MNFVKIPNQIFHFTAKEDSVASKIGCNGFTLYIVLLVMKFQEQAFHNFSVFKTKGISLSLSDIIGFNIGKLKTIDTISESLQLLADNKLIKIDHIPTVKNDKDLKMAITVLEPFDDKAGFEMIHIDILKEQLSELGSNMFALYCYLCVSVRYSESGEKYTSEITKSNISATFNMSDSTVKRMIRQIQSNKAMNSLVEVVNRGSYRDQETQKLVQLPNSYRINALDKKHKYHVPKRKTV